jgi:ABC-type polysaccharide/polyol phosphate transport system ATPase subunit
MAVAQRRSRRSDVAVEFRDVSRRFMLYHERRNSFQDWFISLIRPRGHAEEFWALRDVSFTVGWGESIGVLGRNGAGKSTLLKLVTRILEPTAGEIVLHGDTHAMLELGAGFHPELSGRDNVYLNGSIYGHDRQTMAERIDSIIQFADLEQFIDTPVKHYSSGMFMRLGFAIAIHMDPEILVIDEVLAVGDANFQAKSHRALHQLKEQGTTILFVSHNAQQVRSFCDRAILLENGRLIDSGRTNDVVDHYERLLAGSSETLELMRLRALDREGRSTDVVIPGDDVEIEALLRVPDSGIPGDVALGIDLYDQEGAHLFGRSSPVPTDLPLNTVDGGNLAIARGRIHRLPLRSGELRLVATLQDGGDRDHVLGRREAVVDVVPSGVSAERGMLHLDHEWHWTADGRVPQEIPGEGNGKQS